MKTLTIALVALVASLVEPAAIPKGNEKEAGKEFLNKQKNIIQLLLHVNQPNVFEDQAAIGKSYDLKQGRHPQSRTLESFIKAHNHGLLLSRGEIFSILNSEHAKEANLLSQLLTEAEDYDTFYSTACWARDRINEGVFVTALYTAVLHREDLRGIQLPPVYEINPNLFTDSRVIQQAYNAILRQEKSPIVIPFNHSNSVKFFTEDVGLNNFNTLLSYEFPSWLSNISGRGELFLYNRKQLMARVNLLRLATGARPIDSLQLTPFWPVEEGYIPNLRYRNGLAISGRPDESFLSFNENIDLDEIKAIENRIRNAIDSGTFVGNISGKPTRLFLRDVNALDVIGNLIQGNADSLNKQYFKSLYKMLLQLLSHPTNTDIPGALEHFETMLRDPAYYQVIKRIADLVQTYKDQLSSYTTEQLTVPGVTIKSVDVDELITYEDTTEYSLNNAIDIASKDDIPKRDLKVKQQRLNHKPFNIGINIHSNEAKKIIVRLYLGAKYDFKGNKLSLEEKQQYLVELDRFPYDIEAGQNVIKRSSTESTATAPEQLSITTLLANVEDALQEKRSFYFNEKSRHCGLPHHLLLPKGNAAGFPLSLIVVVSSADGQLSSPPKALISCGSGHGHQDLDDKPFGYPFDLRIKDPEEFFSTPNIYQRDVIIRHQV